jgi:hypothetical protein
MSSDVSFFAKLASFAIFEIIPIVAMLGLTALITYLSVISRKNKTLLSECSMILEDDKFISISENGRSEIQWKALQRVVVTWGYLFLYLSQAGAIIIPRRAFGSEQEWNGFVQFCRSKSAR